MSEATQIAAYAVFFASYLVFALGEFPGLKIDRPGAAIIGAVAMVAAGAIVPQEALHVVDFPTIVLLFSMMLLVAYLHLAGFFEWFTDFAAGRLHPHHLLPTVIFTSGILSAFFVNDIICLVMTPFALNVSRRMGVRPLPYLLAVATATNIGSVATITGNPQNMLIGSMSGIPYLRFLFYLGPVALGGLLLNWLLLWWMFFRRGMQRDEVTLRAAPREASRAALIKPGAVLVGVLAAFLVGIPPALAAAVGAAIMLVSRTRDPRKAYEEVDWGLLVFFIGLFIIVGGAERAGLTEELLALGSAWNLHHPAVFTIATAAFSNIVSNVPAVMLLKSLIPGFANPETGWLLLAMASTLAGNLTITGSIANIIVVERSRGQVHISFLDYFRVGLPLTLLTLLLGALWLAWLT